MKQIDHDPGEFRRPILVAIWSARIHLVIMLAIAFAVMTYYRMGEHETFDLWNVPFILLWLALMAWLIVRGIPPVDGEGHEGAGQGFAFRLGKKLNHILRHRGRNTTVRD